MAGGSGPSIDGKLWIMPLVLEAFGWASAFKSLDAFYDHRSWIGYGASAIVLIVSGGLWIVFRKRLAELWPWYQLRIVKAELTQVLHKNSELQERLDLPKESVTGPSPSQGRLVKPQHNVQCVGFKVISSDPFTISALCFQNVPTGKLMGKFEGPRLRVIYYEHSTGQEITDLCPLQWWDKKDGITDISAEGRDADIASYFEGKWTASETYSDENTLQSRLHSVDLPNGWPARSFEPDCLLV
jgi:hypothetical protein